MEMGQEAYVAPRKLPPQPRGSRPSGGLAARYEQKLRAKRLAGTDGGDEAVKNAIQAAAIAERAMQDGKRRQVSIRELEGRL